MNSKHKPMRLTVDNQSVCTSTDRTRINDLLAMKKTTKFMTKKAIKKRNDQIDKAILHYKESMTAAKWSFVKSIQKFYTEGVGCIGPKFINGVGLFKCKQTGQVRKFSYINYIKQPSSAW